FTDSGPWIQRRIGVLKNHLYISIKRKLLTFVKLMNIFTVIIYISTRFIIKAHNCSANRRFSTTGFTAKPKCFSLIHVKCNIVHCLQGYSALDVKVLFQTVYL